MQLKFAQWIAFILFYLPPGSLWYGIFLVLQRLRSARWTEAVGVSRLHILSKIRALSVRIKYHPKLDTRPEKLSKISL